MAAYTETGAFQYPTSRFLGKFLKTVDSVQFCHCISSHFPGSFFFNSRLSPEQCLLFILCHLLLVLVFMRRLIACYTLSHSCSEGL